MNQKDLIEARKKIDQLISRAKKERDKQGYRENLGYENQRILEEFLETLNLSYLEKADLIQLFYRKCDEI